MRLVASPGWIVSRSDDEKISSRKRVPTQAPTIRNEALLECRGVRDHRVDPTSFGSVQRRSRPKRFVLDEHGRPTRKGSLQGKQQPGLDRADRGGEAHARRLCTRAQYCNDTAMLRR